MAFKPDGKICMCMCVCVCVYMYVCVYVCVAVWCSGCVLGSGPQVPEFKPNSGIFSSDFPSASYQPHHPPSCDWVPGICWGANSRPFLMNSNGPGGTSGAHTTCCEERPVLLRVPSPAPGACLHDSQCLLSAQASWLCQVRVTA